MTTAIAPRVIVDTAVSPATTNHDTDVIQMWLHGRSPHTQDGYRRDVARFLAFVGKPLQEITLRDIQHYADSLVETYAPASQARMLAAVKSLLAFGHKLGYLVVDVGRAVTLPKVKSELAARILDESTILMMIENEPDQRNRTLLRLFYYSGMRLSELCGLRWRDLHARNETGQLTIFGKGGKTRNVLLTPKVYRELLDLRGDADDDDAIFISRHGRPLCRRQVQRIVRAAAERNGVEENVSPHWFRHGHISHALDRGAPIHVVMATSGHASLATISPYLHARPTDSSANYLAG